MKVTASAPSNIALIKYMGKTSAENNLPTNPSISYTLPQLQSFVEIEDSSIDQAVSGRSDFVLDEKGQKRFLKAFVFLKKLWAIEGAYKISSYNDFPSDAGLASSASSFAALTKASWQLVGERKSEFCNEENEAEYLSSISRQLSGSSCRSFFPYWAIWKKEGAKAIKLPFQDLIYQAIVVETERKQVSSSEAHLRVTSSELFEGRTKRAEERLQRLIHSLRKKDWYQIYEVCWQEFQDMHALFSTSKPPFHYMKPMSLEVLEDLDRMWKNQKDGPIVTMDAGPNIHLLYRSDQVEMAETFYQKWKQRVEIYR